MTTPPAPLRDALALAFAMLFPTAMTWVYFVALPEQGAGANPALRTAYWGGKTVQFLFPVVYIACFERSRLRWGRPSPQGLRIGVGFGLLVAAAAVLLYFTVLQQSRWFADTPARIHDRLVQYGLDSPAGFLGMAFYICVIHSWLEEYYWRWFVYTGLARYLPPYPAMLVSGLGFALHHALVLGVYFPQHLTTVALPLTLGVAVGGTVWAWLYHTTNSLTAAWLSHLLIDAAPMAIGYTMLAQYWY